MILFLISIVCKLLFMHVACEINDDHNYVISDKIANKDFSVCCDVDFIKSGAQNCTNLPATKAAKRSYFIHVAHVSSRGLHIMF